MSGSSSGFNELREEPPMNVRLSDEPHDMRRSCRLKNWRTDGMLEAVSKHLNLRSKQNVAELPCHICEVALNLDTVVDCDDRSDHSPTEVSYCA
jgi:hypothetical protein